MIKLSKKWDYALKAICYIADRPLELVHIKDISISEEISESMLRRIIADMERGWILRTVKGRNGWVQLAKAPAQITVYAILESVWEELGLTDCTKWIYCEKKPDCYTTDVLGNLQRWFNALLKMQTLDKIVKK